MEKQPLDLTGLSAQECCVNCEPDRCEISMAAICAHPYKSGLQGAQQHNPEVVRRYQKARQVLAIAKIEGEKKEAEKAPEPPPARHRRANKRRPRPARKPPAPAAAAPETPAPA